MAQGETSITVVGNLVEEPELRYTQAGLAVTNFRIASTPREFDKQANEWKDGESLFLRCNAWRDLAEHIVGSLTKGTRVIVQGRLRQKSYEKDGQSRTAFELEVDEIGPSLRYAKVTGITRSQTSRTQQDNGRPASAPAASGPSTPAGGSGYDEETPF
jgi:single-strand DNA-binding protein